MGLEKEHFGRTQKAIAERIGIKEATIWYWKKNSPASTTALRIARYFSETLDIPFALFEEGNALFNKDFQLVLREYRDSLSETEDGDPKIDAFKNMLAPWEANCIFQVRSLFTGSSQKAMTEKETHKIIQLLTQIRKWQQNGNSKHT